MRNRLTLCIAILIGAIGHEASAAAFRWPWEVRKPVYHRQHHRVQHYPVRRERELKVEQEPKVDCDQIKELVRNLEPARLARVLKSSTLKQRQSIRDCTDMQ